MIPYDIDPSLHTGEPVPAVLDDGFSPPPEQQPVPGAAPDPAADIRTDAALPGQSPCSHHQY